MMELETERLKLRELREGDEKDLVKNANDLEVSKYTATIPYPYTEQDAKDFISRAIKKSREEPREKYAFGIEFEGEIIGTISLTSVDHWTKSCEVGYWIGKEYWKKGFVKESLEKVLEFAFGDLEMQRVEAKVAVENVPSWKLLEKFGFEYEGKLRKEVRPKSTGEFHDVYIYGLLKEDWEKDD